MGAFMRWAQNKAAKHSSITPMAVAMAGASVPITYSMRQAENPGESEGKSMMMAGLDAAGWLFAEPLMWGLTLKDAGVALGKAYVEEARENREEYNDAALKSYWGHDGSRHGQIGGGFRDSENAATMRQRQMAVLRQHKLATENILGSEARQLHR